MVNQIFEKVSQLYLKINKQKKNPSIVPKNTTNVFKLYIMYSDAIRENPIIDWILTPQKQNKSFQSQVLLFGLTVTRSQFDWEYLTFGWFTYDYNKLKYSTVHIDRSEATVRF